RLTAAKPAIDASLHYIGANRHLGRHTIQHALAFRHLCLLPFEPPPQTIVPQTSFDGPRRKLPLDIHLPSNATLMRQNWTQVVVKELLTHYTRIAQIHRVNAGFHAIATLGRRGVDYIIY